jgi:hypothetical protein
MTELDMEDLVEVTVNPGTDSEKTYQCVVESPYDEDMGYFVSGLEYEGWHQPADLTFVRKL